MQKQRVGIVIPIYKKQPNASEMLSIRRCAAVLGMYPIVLVVPEHLDVSLYMTLFPKSETVRLAASWFTGLESYNRLLLTVGFYEKFLSRYEKILILQPDVFVCQDQLPYFLSLEYDFIGGPLGVFRHDRYELFGGNGGCSLRCVAACINILQREADAASWKLNEDEFFSYCGEKFPQQFRIAPLELSYQFAFDRFPRLLYQMNRQTLPFAIHGWYTHDFYFCRQILLRDSLVQDLPVVSNENQLSLEALLGFIKQHKRVMFYGAGEWGKGILQYVQLQGTDIAGFIISDEQLNSEGAYRGKKICHFSECMQDMAGIGIVVTLSRLYRDKVKAMLQRQGIQDVFYISEALCNAVGEQLLRERLGL